MKGIREIAMGSPEPEKPVYTYPKHDEYGSYGAVPKGQSSIFDSELNDDYYGTGYGGGYNPSKSRSYLPDVVPPGRMTLTMEVPISELGDCADDNHPAYNWGRAIDKATEIAYDRLEKLAGKGYESRYALTFKAEEGFLGYEVTVTLTPIK